MAKYGDSAYGLSFYGLGDVSPFDPDDWLVTTTRSLGSFVSNNLNDPDVIVEMSFPDTRNMQKETPLDKVIVHFEQDDITDPVLGFDVPGVDVVDTTDPITPTYAKHEAMQHLVNYDVGIWVPAVLGGATKRMQLTQALKNMLTTATGKKAFNVATGGLWIESFNGGRNELDRINGVPIWRALNMTLVVKVFSRHIPATPFLVPGDADFKQNPDLTIQSATGTLVPVETP